jgi:hypothetical protein
MTTTLNNTVLIALATGLRKPQARVRGAGRDKCRMLMQRMFIQHHQTTMGGVRKA